MEKLRIFVDFAMSTDVLKMLRTGIRGLQLLLPEKPAASVLTKSERDPQFATADVAFGQPDTEAIAEAQKAIVLAGDNADIDLNLAQIYAESGDREQAIRILRKVLARKTEYIPPYTVAGTYAALGDKDRMYEWLDKAIEQHQTACLKLQVVPIFRPYLAEPRFQSIVSKTHQLPVK